MPPASYYEQATGDYVEFHETGSDEIKWWHRTFIEKFSGMSIKGRILDIGCADGRLLKRLKSDGWDIYGLDLDQRSVDVARKNCDTTQIYNCFFEDFIGMVEPHSFDVVTFFEVLEHQVDPKKFIDDVKRILKPGGWIAGSVPNTARYIVPSRFSPDNPPHHFTLWKNDSLERFIVRQGFAGFRLHFTRYELLLVDQVLRHIFYRQLQSLKNEHGIKTLSESKNPSAMVRLIAILKNYFLVPVRILVGVFEYPYLRLTHKSTSMFFEAKYDKE